MTNKEKILKLVELSIEVNDTTEHSVFTSLSGHTKGIDLFGNIGGWKEGSDFDFYHSFYWGGDFDKEYEYISNFLENLKN